MEQTMQATCERVEEAAAFVLGQLSPHQQQRYGEHARGCQTCADELELLNDAAYVPDVMVSAPVRPPHEHEHHDPSRARGNSVDIGGHHDPQSQQSGEISPQSSPPADGHHTGVGGRGRGPGRRRRRIGQPIPKPALAGLTGLLIVAALTVYMSNAAVTTTFARGTTAWPQTAGIALQLQGSHGELLLDHLPAAPQGEHYEIWALRAHARTLTKVKASLVLNANGQAGVAIPGDIHADQAVGVYAMPDQSAPAKPPTVADHPVAVVYVPKRPATR